MHRCMSLFCVLKSPVSKGFPHKTQLAVFQTHLWHRDWTSNFLTVKSTAGGTAKNFVTERTLVAHTHAYNSVGKNLMATNFQNVTTDHCKTQKTAAQAHEWCTCIKHSATVCCPPVLEAASVTLSKGRVQPGRWWRPKDSGSTTSPPQSRLSVGGGAQGL